MPELARLSLETQGDVELARVAGEVDASNVDSSGISLIFDAAARLRNRRQELRLVVTPRSFVGEVLAAVSMEQSVAIDPALDDALRAVAASG